MKANTTELIKFRKLQRRLGESIRGVVGLLELLWQTTAKNCPQGDIGKFSNEDIAVMVDWEGDHDDLIAALVACGWLDESEEHRLIVHDWADHCPTYVRGNLAKGHRSLIETTKGRHKGAPKGTPKEDVLKEHVDSPTTKPNQAYIPSQAYPEREKAHAIPFLETRSTAFLEAWQLWKNHSMDKGKTIHSTTEETQLQLIFAAYPDEAEAIKAIKFSIGKNWANVNLTNDHNKPPDTNKSKPAAVSTDDLIEKQLKARREAKAK